MTQEERAKMQEAINDMIVKYSLPEVLGCFSVVVGALDRQDHDETTHFQDVERNVLCDVTSDILGQLGRTIIMYPMMRRSNN